MSIEITNIEFISPGFREILYSEGVKNAVASVAQKIQAEANGAVSNSKGFRANTYSGGYGGGRWIASVTSIDRAAAAAESEHQVLSKAVHG